MSAESELKKLIERLQPDLKPYMRFSLVGMVAEVYEDEYLVDVELDDDISLPRVPVHSVWAEDGWGIWALPEIGSEVSVSFVEGDVTRPYVEASRFVTGKTPQGYKVGMFAIRDKAGQRIEFKPDESELSIKGANIKIISAGNRSEYVLRNRISDVGGDSTTIIGKSRSEKVGGSVHEEITGDLKQIVSGLVEQEIKKLNLTVKSDYTQKIGGGLNIQVSGARQATILGAEMEAVAKHWQKIIGGNVDIMITNADPPSPTAFALAALTGNISISTLAGLIQLGGALAISPAVKGTELTTALTNLANIFANNATTIATAPSGGGPCVLSPTVVTALGTWIAALTAIISAQVMIAP
jgi:Type VI secretion system/phage-baseplate injector OB domain